VTKSRKQQAKRQKSRGEQAKIHDDKRWKKALAEYQGSLEQKLDMGPDYKKKRRQKNSN
jgi:hypothetical protein